MIASTVKRSSAGGRDGEAGAGLMPTIFRRGSDRNSPVAPSHPGGTMGRPAPAGALIDKGLIGFDVGTGSDIVRPELLRLVKTGQHNNCQQAVVVRTRRLVIR